LYRLAAGHALNRGIIVADTKFEFGVTTEGELILIDEVMTPDSSRFWPRDGYKPGRPQPSFDKQFVRDYLQSLMDQGLWDGKDPAPHLPGAIIQGTSKRYIEAYERITGEDFPFMRYR
jgi:phosphoribosylaminoimidazole-succinocarboxamide synthase